MSGIYDITANSGDSHQVSNKWIALFVRYSDVLSFNRSNPGDINRSTENSTNNVTATTELVVANDCTSFQISSSKSSHVNQLTLTLANRINYTNEVNPGDWVFFWAFNDTAKYEEVLKKIINKQRANDFFDGLKFVGKLDSIFERTIVNQKIGQKSTTYTVNAFGFSEFNAIQYYNEIMTIGDKNILSYMCMFKSAIDSIVTLDGIAADTIIPKLVNLTLGAAGKNNDRGAGAPNQIFKIPETVAQLIIGPGALPLKMGGWTYLDILTRVIGIQKYDWSLDFQSKFDFFNSHLKGYMPSVGPQIGNNELVVDRIYRTGTPIYGKSLPTAIAFNRNPTWSILQTFLCSPINEMYNCLRVDPTGHIMPTFVCRQTPFTSEEFAKANQTIVATRKKGKAAIHTPVTTRFFELPRWGLSEKLVIDENLGKSDAARFNLVFLTGQNIIGGDSANATAIQYTDHKPIVDLVDTYRNGTRPFHTTIGVDLFTTWETSSQGFSYLRDLAADFLIGRHLTLSGTITSYGIQEPICIGDNLQYKDMVFHIEGIIHHGDIDHFGKRRFMTTLQVSNGLALKEDYSDAIKNIDTLPIPSTSELDS